MWDKVWRMKRREERMTGLKKKDVNTNECEDREMGQKHTVAEMI
jgi:hypothetical protein